MKHNILTYKKFTLFLSAVLISTTFAGCSAKKVEVKQQPPTNVKTIQVSKSTIITQVEYSGKLKAVQEVNIFPKNSGKVTAVKGIVGATVTKGDVLLTLDPKEVQAQLSQQQASLASARANLEKTKDSTFQQQMVSADQTLKKAEISYNDATANYDKNSKLYSAGVVSKQALDDASTKLNNETINFNSAKDNYILLKDKSGPQSVDVATAQVQQAAAGVDLVTAQMDNTIITAPFSGVISARNVEEGDLASGSKAVFTVIDASVLIAEISVPDSMVSGLQVGQSIPIKINVLDNKEVNGTIDTISPSADSKTQAYTIRIKIDNSDNILKAGMFARVILTAEKKENVITVPNETIKTENGVQYLYIVEKDTVKKKAVEIGLSNDKITEITNNLKEGDNVVSEGQTFLKDGQKVKIVTGTVQPSK